MFQRLSVFASKFLLCGVALTACLLAATESVTAGDVAFRKIVLNAESRYSAAAAFDVDHDGDVDVVCGGYWYENPGWEKHVVRDVEMIRGEPDGFAAQPCDVNGDGWMDFLEANYRSATIKWIEHPGEALGLWTPHLIDDAGPMESGRLEDVDGDGQVDLLPNGARWAAWWRFVPKEQPDGTKLIEFARQDLPDEVKGHGIAFGDVNGDGRGDVVSGNGWLEAPEDRINGTWEWHPEFEIGRVSVPFLVVDPDGDGDNDLIYSIGHDYGLFWLEQKGDGESREWEKHVIDMSWSQAHFLLWEDMDQDGTIDVVAGKRYMAHGGKDPGAHDPLVVYRYEFNLESTRGWDRWMVSNDPKVGFGLDAKAVDIDGDGDLDLVCPGRSGLHLLVNTLK